MNIRTTTPANINSTAVTSREDDRLDHRDGRH